MLQIAENIKLIRQLSGKTQSEFGVKFDATKAMIVSYEKGKAQPNFLFIDRLAKHTGLQADRLMKVRLKEEDINKEKLEKLFKEENGNHGTSEDQNDRSKSSMEDPNLSLQTIHNLSQSNKILAEAAKIKAETDKLREEKEKVLVQSNADLTSLLKSTAHAPEENILANPHVQMKLLETLAELGTGTLWKTKDDGLILLGNRFAVPTGEALKKESTRVGAGKKSIA